MDAHDTAVASVAARIEEFYHDKIPFRVYHGSTNSTHKSVRTQQNVVDTSGLNHVLAVDVSKKTIIVEPNVPMDALVEATLKYNLVPLVVMEFPGITCGGGFSGTSGESSSFRYGFFDATVNWIEIVLANGKKTRASKTHQPDLFWGAASAFGTLGIITSLEINLKEAKRYVALTYYHLSNISRTISFLQDRVHKNADDYLDAITYAKDSTIVCIGHLTDDLPKNIQSRQLRRARDPWFFVHVDRLRKRIPEDGDPSSTLTDYIPLTDYLFRYDRGAFWTGKYAFKYFITPFNRITRFILDPFMQTRVMYRAMHKSGMVDYYMIQDVAVPYNEAEDFIAWLETHFGLYPLWLCPLRTSRESSNSAHGILSEFGHPGAPPMLNIGIWGLLSFNRKQAIAQNRKLEQHLTDIGGKKWMYAQGYYTPAEFWKVHDLNSYSSLRSKYHAEYLPNVYDKVNVDVAAEGAASKASLTAILLTLFWSIWPFRGLYGVFWTLFAQDYLLNRTPGAALQRVKSQ